MATQEAVFWKALDEIEKLNLVPNGYGVAQTEWLKDEYPTWESLQVGSG